MLTLKEVDRQLKTIGCNFFMWGRREVKELGKVLADDEQIRQCINGHYEGGFAMLVATNQRLLLVDRKPMFLTIEAVWYDKIAQVDFNRRLLNATICIHTFTKDLTFTSMNTGRLHDTLIYSQEMMTLAKQGMKPQIADEVVESQKPTSIGKQTDPSNLIGRPYVPSTLSRIQEPLRSMNPNNAISSTRLPFSRRRYFAVNNEA